MHCTERERRKDRVSEKKEVFVIKGTLLGGKVVFVINTVQREKRQGIRGKSSVCHKR